MNILTLFLCAMLQAVSIDSNQFYKENLDPISIDGTFISKKIAKDFYLIKVENKTGDNIEFRLLRNIYSFNIYSFISEGSYIIKRPGKREIHVMNKIDGGGYNVQIFDKLK